MMNNADSLYNKTAANHFGAVSGSTFTINYVLYNLCGYIFVVYVVTIITLDLPPIEERLGLATNVHCSEYHQNLL